MVPARGQWCRAAVCAQWRRPVAPASGAVMARAVLPLLFGLGTLAGAASRLCAQTNGAAPRPSLPFAGSEIVLVVGLAITAVAVIAALVAIRRLRRANTLQIAIFGAIPQPRQVVDSDGRTVFANQAFHDFFGGVDKPTPELLAVEVAGDEEAQDRLDRLVANARNGVSGYAELPVRPRRPRQRRRRDPGPRRRAGSRARGRRRGAPRGAPGGVALRGGLSRRGAPGHGPVDGR